MSLKEAPVFSHVPWAADSVDIRSQEDIRRVEIHDARTVPRYQPPSVYPVTRPGARGSPIYKITEGGLSSALGFVRVNGGGSYAGFLFRYLAPRSAPCLDCG